MCVQCVVSASGVAVGASAVGARAWLATRGWMWLTAPRLRTLSLALMVAAAAAVAAGS